MPPKGKEIHLTEMELDIMRIFMREAFFSDERCARVLEVLTKKLRGTYSETK